MKKIICLAACSFVVLCAEARECRWTGGGNGVRWSDAANWDGAAPATGDSLLFEGAAGDAISARNDIPGISLEKIRCLGGASVSLSGEAVSLTGAEAWTNSTAAGCSMPINLRPANSGNTLMSFGVNARFDADVVSFGTTGYFKVSGAGNPVFYGHVVSSNQNFMCLMKNGAVHFFDSVYLKGISSTDYVYGSLHFHTTNNVVGTIEPVLWTCEMECENTFAPGTIWSWGTYYVENNVGRSFYQLHGYDQTIDRFGGSTRPHNAGVLKAGCYAVRSTSPATLTLKATADCTTYANLHENISLVWDPQGNYTLHMPERAHNTAGTLTVKGGTMRLSESGCFPNVTAITVGADAEFDLASTNDAVRSLASLKTVTLADNARFSVTNRTVPVIADGTATFHLSSSARIALRDGFLQKVGRVMVDGVSVAAGTYTGNDGDTGTKVSWIQGKGRLEVAGDSGTWWTGAVDADFNNAGNWTAGVPTAATPGGISKYGQVSVNVATAPAAPVGDLSIDNFSGLTLFNVTAPLALNGGTVALGAGTEVRVGQGGEWRQDFTGAAATDSTETFSLHNGATFTVAGGFASLTNTTGRIAIGGSSAGDEGTLEISAGTCLVTKASGNFMQIAKHGTLRMTGGVFETVNFNAIGQSGGLIDLSGDARMVSTFGNFDTVLRTVTLRMRDNSVFKNAPIAQSRWYFTPNNAGETCLMELADNAVMDVRNDAIHFCMRTGGRTILRMRGNSRFLSANGVNVGSGNGTYAEIDIGDNAYFEQAYYDYGINIGYGANSTDSPAEGVVKISGGILLTGRSPNANTSLQGLMVGNGTGGNYQGTVAKGAIYISGGAITNRNNGAFAIGAGSASGVVEQSGGRICHLGSAPLFVGYCGGVGTYTMTGGELYIDRSDAFVGGVQAERSGFSISALASRTVPARGTLSVLGGVLDARRSLYVSDGGYGTLVIGPTGLVQVAQNVYFTNSVDAAAGVTAPAKLKFTLGPDGCGRLVAGGTCHVSEGAQVEIDASGYTAKRGVDLLSCSSLEGRFADGNVRIIADNPGIYSLQQTANGLRLACDSGTLLIFR